MPSPAQTVFEERLLNEAGVLRDIVKELTGVAAGRRERRLNVLHRSSIVLLTAGFEAYCESILIASIEILGKLASGPAILPADLRINVALQKDIAKNKSDLFSWDFAEAGWRDLIVNYCISRIDAFHTPSPENIQKLFASLLGIEEITTFWARQGMTAENARDTLDKWLKHRHGIAHGAEDIPVVLADVTSYENFLRQTVSRTDKTVENHLTILLGQSPW
jgi:hypothetical protein